MVGYNNQQLITVLFLSLFFFYPIVIKDLLHIAKLELGYVAKLFDTSPSASSKKVWFACQFWKTLSLFHKETEAAG